MSENTWEVIGEVAQTPGLPARTGRAQGITEATHGAAKPEKGYAAVLRSEWRLLRSGSLRPFDGSVVVLELGTTTIAPVALGEALPRLHVDPGLRSEPVKRSNYYVAATKKAAPHGVGPQIVDERERD